MASSSDATEEIKRLRALLAAEQKRTGALAAKVKKLEHQLELLKKQLFGKSSEKVDSRQLQLAFDEACAEAAAAEAPLSDEPYPGELLEELARAENDEDPNPKEKKKRRRRRNTRFPPDLDVVRGDEIHPPQEDLLCACGCGKIRMGEEVSRRLEKVPARFYWREEVRVKYICPSCRDITRPPLPPAPIEKGLAGASVLADVLLSKYLDHLPLDRLERIYNRDGIHLLSPRKPRLAKR
ncbi:IS66 family transposase zinc-finger binding domain-containing protein [Planctomycetota bacterium]|nr:IS66 family transposase zinc-finger binding domain-containing protein [Planctomycetota bacterium]